MTFDVREMAIGGEFVAIDVEGDGYSDCRPVEISLIRFSKGEPCFEWHSLINPERPIGDFVQGIHGITDDMVRDAPTFSEIRNEFIEIVSGANLVAYNIQNDMRMLHWVMPDAYQFPARLIDAIRVAKNLIPDFSRQKLEDFKIRVFGEEFEIPDPDREIISQAPHRSRKRHSASYDAEVAGRAMVHLLREHDMTSKQARHISQAVEYKIGKKVLAELQSRIDAEIGENVRGLSPSA